METRTKFQPAATSARAAAATAEGAASATAEGAASATAEGAASATAEGAAPATAEGAAAATAEGAAANDIQQYILRKSEGKKRASERRISQIEQRLQLLRCREADGEAIARGGTGHNQTLSHKP